ncbi:carbamate kinase [Vulcanisaeta distributa]|uniref:Carbamate kinase n=1 Tax=Vulcanisaeta distributa (strain DSM 14429 / JCM 11212 / NBRC 100878 / IC-017) TaxID=572478 RepID=E1QNQ0_VULDI|nr:carbamate kinase [Vulcanisaeta distributa]ADN50146.1 aspartate/glutamate/uridylate kinase [Vulcanisaeta distributa DSM 14429]
MLAVIALGGNAFAREGARVGLPEEQWESVKLAAGDVADMIEEGFDVVVTHGNGPQAGLLAERVSDYLSLDMIDAATEGWMGYLIANALTNEFMRRGIRRSPVIVVSRSIVNKNDSAFQNPTKYIGPLYDKETADKLSREKGWVFRWDARGGFRRVVPSPEPMGLMELDLIRLLLREGYIPIAVGGGGIPVIVNGEVQGVDAVIDKDLASQVLANAINADYLLILTDVDYVYINYRKPNQKKLIEVTISELEKYYNEGQFPPGSMGPKVLAAIRFIKNGGKTAYIGPLGRAKDIIRGRIGTKIVR